MTIANIVGYLLIVTPCFLAFGAFLVMVWLDAADKRGTVAATLGMLCAIAIAGIPVLGSYLISL